MNKLFNVLIASFAGIMMSGCGGGMSAPSDDDTISVVKLTDLRLGYQVNGLITDDIALDSRYDLGFCNDEITLKMEFSGDLVDDQYSEGTYEIIGDNILVYSNGGSIIDTGDSGVFEEGEKYFIENSRDTLTWRVGSISKKECIVEPI